MAVPQGFATLPRLHGACGRSAEGGVDAVPEGIFVGEELGRFVLGLLIVAGGGDHGEHGIVIIVLHQVGDILDREVGVQEAFHLIKGVDDEVGVVLVLSLGLGGEGVDIEALVAHTGDVGVQAVVRTGPDEAEGLLPFQLNGGALDILLAKRGDIVLKGDGDAADQVVEDGDGVHAEGEVAVNGRAEEQAVHGTHRVLAAVMLAGAKAVGIGDLHGLVAAHQAIDREPGHVAHGVAVDLKRGDGLLCMIEDHEEEVVGHAVVVEGLDLAGLLVFHAVVRTDEENALEAALDGIDLTVVVDEAGIEGIGIILAGGTGLLQLGQDNGHDEQDQDDQVRDQDEAPVALILKLLEQLGHKDSLNNSPAGGGALIGRLILYLLISRRRPSRGRTR